MTIDLSDREIRIILRCLKAQEADCKEFVGATMIWNIWNQRAAEIRKIRLKIKEQRKR